MSTQPAKTVAIIGAGPVGLAAAAHALERTGVCNRSPVAEADGCRGGPAKSNASACCVADETAKAEGKAGCGCGPKAPQPKKASACRG